MDATRYLVMSGIARAGMRPMNEWRHDQPGRPPWARPKHQTDYSPFKEAIDGVLKSPHPNHQRQYDPFGEARNVGNNRPGFPRQGWMPGRN
jgi:hypothetical protein